MRILVLVIAFMLLAPTAGFSADQEAGTTCPAHRAAEAGFDPFDGFHEVMAPAWHQAWPDSNFVELFAAGPKFEAAFQKVAEMKPEFKSAARAEVFEARRTELGRLVKAYAEAAQAEDKDQVYGMMPGLHEAFEMAAGALLPVDFPQFEGVVITLNLILETHLPKNNADGISGSTETLVAKLQALTAEALPLELKEHEAAIQTDFAAMSEVAGRMQKCCQSKDMETYEQHIKALDAQVKQFIQRYI